MEGRRVMILKGTPWEAFDRDCCMLFENIFFAEGKGIDFDDVALQILQQAQPGVRGIDQFAIFGRTERGWVNGLRGTFLKMECDQAKDFIEWAISRAKPLKMQRGKKDELTKTHCN